MKLALIALLLPSALAAVKKTAANAKETAFLEEYAAASSPYTPMYAIDAILTGTTRTASLPEACTPTATAAGRATGSARIRGANQALRST